MLSTWRKYSNGFWVYFRICRKDTRNNCLERKIVFVCVCVCVCVCVRERRERGGGGEIASVCVSVSVSVRERGEREGGGRLRPLGTSCCQLDPLSENWITNTTIFWQYYVFIKTFWKRCAFCPDLDMSIKIEKSNCCAYILLEYDIEKFSLRRQRQLQRYAICWVSQSKTEGNMYSNVTWSHTVVITS